MVRAPGFGSGYEGSIPSPPVAARLNELFDGNRALPDESRREK